MDINKVRGLCEEKKLRWTNHIFVRLVQRNISMNDITNAIMSGEIIEQYPDDYPYPSCLILGITVGGKKIHIVCGTNDIELWLITAYYPDKDKWSEDYRSRKER